jgi:hypothetical protein
LAFLMVSSRKRTDLTQGQQSQQRRTSSPLLTLLTLCEQCLLPLGYRDGGAERERREDEEMRRRGDRTHPSCHSPLFSLSLREAKKTHAGSRRAGVRSCYGCFARGTPPRVLPGRPHGSVRSRPGPRSPRPDPWGRPRCRTPPSRPR